MEIRRYKERIATDWILDAVMGDWCRYEDVEPLLERIDKLEQLEAKLSKSVDSVKKLRDEWYVRDLTQSDFDTIIAELTDGKGEDVEPLLERIKELERYYNGDVKLLLERIKELEKQLEFERSLEDKA